MKVPPACVIVCYILVVSLVNHGSATLSKLKLDFLCTLNGDGDNSAEIRAGIQGIVPVSGRGIPVMVPAIETDTPCVYLEEIMNGRTKRAMVWTVQLDKEGYIRNHYYNVTEAFQFSPGTYDVARLASLKSEDLPPYPSSCEATFKQVVPGFYVGSYVYCMGKGHPLYVDTLTCKTFFFTPPKESMETLELEPYELPYTKKYPIPGAPKDFVCDCHQKN